MYQVWQIISFVKLDWDIISQGNTKHVPGTKPRGAFKYDNNIKVYSKDHLYYKKIH